MNSRLIPYALLSSAAVVFCTQHLSAWFGAAAAFIAAFTVNSSVWEVLGCAAQNSMKNKFTSNGSYFS